MLFKKEMPIFAKTYTVWFEAPYMTFQVNLETKTVFGHHG